jgi:energy-coupling factor transporter ATP-binding protein EcfA2
MPTLRDINLEIGDGDFILLSGPTGCGKTTLCRCITGLIPNFHTGTMEGQVIVDGLNTLQHPVYEIAKKVGMVFQNPENQLVAMNVERELGFALENLGVPAEKIREKIEEIVDEFQLNHLRMKAPYEISGGEQQRVAIASILILDPGIIILDEPTSNLDPAAAEKMMFFLKELNSTYKKTIILIEHRLELVVPLINRMIVLDQGELVLDGPPEEVLLDEKIQQINIGLPKIVQLYKVIKEAGVNFEKIPLTSAEFAEALQQIKGGR